MIAATHSVSHLPISSPPEFLNPSGTRPVILSELSSSICFPQRPWAQAWVTEARATEAGATESRAEGPAWGIPAPELCKAAGRHLASEPATRQPALVPRAAGELNEEQCYFYLPGCNPLYINIFAGRK